MKLLGLQHVSIVVTDMEKSRHFYGNVLGMRPLQPPGAPTTVAWFEAAGTEIHLILHQPGYNEPTIPQSAPSINDGGATHLAFAVNSIAATIQQLAETGTEIICGPRPRGDGVEQVYVQDPDGYLIELFVWG